MKILVVVDKIPSAISNLSFPLKKYLDHHEIIIFPIHPKRNSADVIFDAQKALNWADIIHVNYWKSGEVLRTTFPVEFNRKPKMMTMHNPYDYDKSDWSSYKIKTAFNSQIQMQIAGSYLIKYGIDLDFFKFNPEYTEEKTVMMCVARIEGKKGVLEVAQACQELGYKFILVGRISETEYFNNIAKYDCVEFLENITQEKLLETYYRSAIHVCNSTDNFESGTLPILEAMACGVPVLTRNVGQVPDISDGTNIVIRKGTKDDIEDLKNNLREMMENRPLREKIRERGWETVKTMSDKVMCRRFDKLYYKLKSDKRLVSVIIPTFDRPEVLLSCLVSVINQDYPNLEIVVSDSGNVSAEPLIKEFRKHTEIPIKYIRFNNNGEYTLPKARNLAVQKSIGEVLVFCDERMILDRSAITEFEKRVMHKKWLWGVKDDCIKGFVENFSCILREDFILGGMCNERINTYGGQTQELRTRFETNGFEFENCVSAKAHSDKKSSKNKHKDSIIKAKYILQELYEN